MSNRWFIGFLFLILGGVVSARVYAVFNNTDQALGQSSSESVCSGRGDIDILQYMRPSELDNGQPGKSILMTGCYTADELQKDNTIKQVSKGAYDDANQVIAKVIDNEPFSPLPENLARTGFLIEKGAAYPADDDEWWFYDNDNVYLYQDRSAGFQCTNTPGLGFYREQSERGGQLLWGGPYQRCVNDGVSNPPQPRIYTAYSNDSGGSCTIDWDGPTGNKFDDGAGARDKLENEAVSIKVTKVYDEEGVYLPNDNNFLKSIAPKVNDTIVIELVGGPGTGERRFYSRGYGFTGYHETTEGKVTFHVRGVLTIADAGGEECEGEETDENRNFSRGKNDYVPYHIPGFTDHINEGNWKEAAKDLARAGYDATCTEFSIDETTRGDYDKWLRQNEGKLVDTMDGQAENTISLDASSGNIGFLRNKTVSSSHNADVTNYFGTPKGTTGNAYDQRLAIAPMYSQAKSSDIFRAKVDALRARETLAEYGQSVEEREEILFRNLPDMTCDLKDTYKSFKVSGLEPEDLARPFTEIASKTSLSEAQFKAQQACWSEVPANIGDVSVDTFNMVAVEQPKTDRSASQQLFPGLGGKQFNYFTDVKAEDEALNTVTDPTLSQYRMAALSYPTPAVDFDKYTASVNYTEPQQWSYQTTRSAKSLKEEAEAEQKRREELMAAIDGLTEETLNGQSSTLPQIFKKKEVEEGPETGLLALKALAIAAKPMCEQNVLAETAQSMKVTTDYSDDPKLVEKNGISSFNLFSRKDPTGNSKTAKFSFFSTIFIGKEADKLKPKKQPTVRIYTYSLYNNSPKRTAQLLNPFMPQNILRSIEMIEEQNRLAAANNEGSTATILGGTKLYPPNLGVEGMMPDISSEEVCKTYVEPDPASAESCETNSETGEQVCYSKFCTTLTSSSPQGVSLPNVNKGLFGSVTAKHYLYAKNSPQQEHVRNSTTVEEYLAFADAQTETDVPQTSGEWTNPGGTPAAGSCSYYESQDVKVPSFDAMEKMIENAAKANFGGDPTGRYKQMLFGIVNIEGSPFLAAQRAGVTSFNCKEGYNGRRMINDCGAIGPLQVIQGVCVKDTCAVQPQTLAYLKTFKRDVNPCNFEETLFGIAKFLGNLSRSDFAAEVDPGQMPYFLAGYYYGFTKENYLLKNKCEGAPPVSGCNGLNYCKCAVDGFVL